PTAKTAMHERRKEPPTVAQARKFTFARPMNLPRTPQKNAPTSGRAMITQSRSAIATGFQGYEALRRSMSRSEPHRPDVVDVHRPAAAEHGDDDRQADRRLGGRHRDHEERRQVPRVAARVASEGEEGEVRGVEHQL